MGDADTKIATQLNKRRKYVNYSSKSFRGLILPNQKGFLCSFNFREKDCIREAYSVLNEYADLLDVNQADNVSTLTNKDNIDDLTSEIEDVKKINKKVKRFQVVESGAKNLLFIHTTLDDPVRLGLSIIEDINIKKDQKTKFLIRLIPVEITCKAYLEEIIKTFSILVKKHFNCPPVSYAIVCNQRNNNHIIKEELINSLASIVHTENSNHTVNLKNAQLSVVVEIIKNNAFLAVLPNYLKYKKYNLVALSSNEDNVTNNE